MSFFCNCKDDLIEIKRTIKAMQTDIDTLEIKALEAKRAYSKKLKALDKEENTETKDIYSGMLLPE